MLRQRREDSQVSISFPPVEFCFKVIVRVLSTSELSMEHPTVQKIESGLSVGLASGQQGDR